MLRNIYPCLAARRNLDRFNQGLHALAGAKVEWLGPLLGNGRQKSGDLDSFQIIKAELVTRSDAEKAVWKVIRPRLDPTKAAASGGVLHAEEMQLIEALLREKKRAFAP